MIQEIINFVGSLPEEVFTYNLKPKEGLYVFLDIDEDCNLVNVDEEGQINDEDIDFYSKKDEELSPLITKCLPLWMNTIPVSNAKIFNPIKKVALFTVREMHTSLFGKYTPLCARNAHISGVAFQQGVDLYKYIIFVNKNKVYE